MDAPRDDRSLGQLFGDLSRQLSTLIRQEIDLARTEVTTKATAAGRDAALAGIGGALIYAAFLGLMAAVALALAEAGWSPWVAALVVAIIVGIVGGALVARGRAGLMSVDPTPRRTVESLKEDAEWAKDRVR